MPRTHKKIPKPYPDYPLFADANGSWRKKIAGKKPSFGPVRWPDRDEYERSWREALACYHRYLEAEAHRTAIAADPRICTLGLLHDGFLTEKHKEAEAGTLKPRTFAAIRAAVREYRDTLGASLRVGDLEADPRPLHAYLAGLDKRLGFHAYNRTNQYVRSMWNWAARPAGGLLDRPFKWAALHRLKPMRTFRKQRRLERAAGVFMTFDADEVAALVQHAEKGWRLSPHVRAYVLLGYFAGYGNTDLAEFPRTAVRIYERDETIFVRGRAETIPAGWALIDFPRPKTEIDRCAIVPPIVVEAIRAVEAVARPALPETRDLIFRTEGGRPVVYDVVHRDDSGFIERTTPTDNVAAAFSRLLKSVGWCDAHGWVRRRAFLRAEKPSGAKAGKSKREEVPALCPECSAAIERMKPRGFYCLRHTATTFAAGSGASNDARNLFEGHGGGGVRQAFYLDPTKLHDLLLIAQDLERRLEDARVSGSAQSRRRPASVQAASPARPRRAV